MLNPEILPYRVFEYSDNGVECRLRPEEARGWHSYYDDEIRWHVAVVLMRDQIMRLRFREQAAARHFIDALTDFIHQDAARNAKNAAVRNSRKD